MTIQLENGHSKFIEALKETITQISHSLGDPLLECHFQVFESRRPGREERSFLRSLLCEKLKSRQDGQPAETHTGEWNNLLTPGGRPESSRAVISISHCPGLGGFIFSPGKQRPIGLDMEKTERVRGRIIRRVSTERELRQTPNFALLWTAKESGLKCLKGNRLILKRCVISNWSEQENWHNFSFQNGESRGEGGAFQFGPFSLALSRQRA